jgi:hypothetical protein
MLCQNSCVVPFGITATVIPEPDDVDEDCWLVFEQPAIVVAARRTPASTVHSVSVRFI